ncbi:MAG: FAD binding domain-containing protein, partial [Longimicrobiales bacterium]
MLRLPRYAYHRPRRLDEALALLDRHGETARVVAGGTDLIPNMKHRLFEPDHLVALSGVEELQGIHVDDGVVDIGAAVTLDAVARHPDVGRRLQALADP